MSEATNATTTTATAGDSPAGGSAESGIDMAGFRKEVEAIAESETGAPKGAGTTTQEQEPEGVEEEQATEEESPAVETDAEFKPTQRQVDLAKQLGMSDEQIEGLTPAMAEIIDRLGTRQSQMMSKLGRLQQDLLAKTKGKEAATTTGKQEAASATNSDGGEGFFRSSDFDTDEGLLTKLNTMSSRVDSLLATIEQLKAKEERTTTENQFDAVDKFFAGLDADDYPQFGKGAALDLDPDSEHFKARDAVCAKASALRAGYAMLNDGQEMPLETAMQEALLIVASDSIKANAEKKVLKNAQKRSTQRIARPTNQQQRLDNQSEEERAESVIREKAAKLGIPLPS